MDPAGDKIINHEKVSCFCSCLGTPCDFAGAFLILQIVEWFGVELRFGGIVVKVMKVIGTYFVDAFTSVEVEDNDPIAFPLKT